jgi:hypothetical protein
VKEQLLESIDVDWIAPGPVLLALLFCGHALADLLISIWCVDLGDRAHRGAALLQLLDRHPCLQIELRGHPAMFPRGNAGAPDQKCEPVTLGVAVARDWGVPLQPRRDT